MNMWSKLNRVGKLSFFPVMNRLLSRKRAWTPAETCFRMFECSKVKYLWFAVMYNIFFCAVGLLTSENRAIAPTGTKDRRKWISVFGRQPRHFFFSLSLFVNIEREHRSQRVRTERNASPSVAQSLIQEHEKAFRGWNHFSFLSPSKGFSFLAAFIY